MRKHRYRGVEILRGAGGPLYKATVYRRGKKIRAGIWAAERQAALARDRALLHLGLDDPLNLPGAGGRQALRSFAPRPTASVGARSAPRATPPPTIPAGPPPAPTSAPPSAAGVYDRALCVFESPVPSSEHPESHLDWLLEFLSKYEEGIADISGHCEIDVRVGFSADSGQGGLALSSADLAKLGKLGIGLFVDLFPWGSDCEE